MGGERSDAGRGRLPAAADIKEAPFIFKAPSFFVPLPTAASPFHHSVVPPPPAQGWASFGLRRGPPSPQAMDKFIEEKPLGSMPSEVWPSDVSPLPPQISNLYSQINHLAKPAVSADNFPPHKTNCSSPHPPAFEISQIQFLHLITLLSAHHYSWK